MTRRELEHALRAVADLTGETTLIIIGSQAILGTFPEAPSEMLVSQEVDIFTPEKPETAEFISGAFGADSPFDQTHGFQIDGVSPTTATVPGGWQNRLIPVCNANTNGATGWCLDVHDIAVAKYFAEATAGCGRTEPRSIFEHLEPPIGHRLLPLKNCAGEGTGRNWWSETSAQRCRSGSIKANTEWLHLGGR